MIKIINGDLLEAKEDIIGHQVNCQGVMGSGVALSIKKEYPNAYKQYKNFVDVMALDVRREDLLGHVQFVPTKDKYVANIFGQYNYGYDKKQYTNTDALFTAFKHLRKFAELHNLSVALPYMIGCYRGGGDWKIVEDHLLTAFEGYEVTLYKMHKG